MILIPRDSTYFVVGTNAVNFNNIEWYEYDFEKFTPPIKDANIAYEIYGSWAFTVFGKVGDFYFKIDSLLKKERFSPKKWMENVNYCYEKPYTISKKDFLYNKNTFKKIEL